MPPNRLVSYLRIILISEEVSLYKMYILTYIQYVRLDSLELDRSVKVMFNHLHFTNEVSGHAHKLASYLPSQLASCLLSYLPKYISSCHGENFAHLKYVKLTGQECSNHVKIVLYFTFFYFTLAVYPEYEGTVLLKHQQMASEFFVLSSISLRTLQTFY